MVFDLNNNGVIEPEEISEAYLHKKAASTMVRLLEQTEGAPWAGKGVTWQVLETLDLNSAIRNKRCAVSSEGEIDKQAFTAWITAALDEISAMGDHMEGHQDEHE